MLTHVCHAFAWPDSQGRLKMPKEFLLPALNTSAHACGVKVILGVGGGDGSASFPAMTRNPTCRARFVRAVAAFAVSNTYDGIELDWEFPKVEQDRLGLILLARELRAALGPKRSLSVAISGSKYTATNTDVAALDPSVDFFVMMGYDCHGGWSDYSGHNAPLLPYPRSDGSVKEGVDYWLHRGMPRAKLVLGMPFYGRAFACTGRGTLFTECDNLDYREIVQLAGKGYTRHWDATARVPYLLAKVGKQFISYDDTQSLALKTAFAVQSGMGGVAVWQLTGDMVNGRHLLLPGIRARLNQPEPPAPARLLRPLGGRTP